MPRWLVSFAYSVYYILAYVGAWDLDRSAFIPPNIH